MQPTPIKRSKKNNTNNILLITFFSIFSCFGGIILGFGGSWIFLQQNPSARDSLFQTTPQMPEQTYVEQSSDKQLPVGQIPTEEGFFISSNDSYIKIPESADDRNFEISSLPSTNNTEPVFIVRGKNLPMSNLRLSPYTAGIGIDATYSKAGAVINHVFENSPANMANLQPGELITLVNGEPTRMNSSYTPGKADLFGAMEEKITLTVLAGTSKRIVELPRTYRALVIEDSYSVLNSSIHFVMEPKDDYVEIQVTNEIKPGVYRFEFREDTIISYGGLFGPTSTPTLLPIPIPIQNWIFVVK